ncbi:hypothetical protein ILYODFUR_021316 [Ilyodon furcidens]|uniref:Uncharacterized protein n=1 Tax=Ilyodon furcidens TaxID=33524 RepID=A0ABV0SYX5_9TELE
MVPSCELEEPAQWFHGHKVPFSLDLLSHNPHCGGQFTGRHGAQCLTKQDQFTCPENGSGLMGNLHVGHVDVQLCEFVFFSCLNQAEGKYVGSLVCGVCRGESHVNIQRSTGRFSSLHVYF